MSLDWAYKAGITREKYLFNEMRICARFLLEGKSDKEIIAAVYDDNLFQYPTTKTLKEITRICLKRLHLLQSKVLINVIANSSSSCAKQVCLYAMIKQYRIVYEFMTGVIGEKYRLKDLSYSKIDINVFFTRLQEQNSCVASWSEATIKRIKQVLNKMLVENEYLDSIKSTTLNPVLIDLELKEVLKERNEKAILSAFNCFE